ncbi:hypothetical protein [Stenotrophomonas maltophilia]|uniref:hypothetical protein n=1 Tax=Stenotrophomonas maltophilia TaxID=40324 RepID=UPI0013D934C7|nr:hypothetical protein [Stenotrophomonas maltophilia]
MSASVDVVALLRALQSQIGPSRPDEEDDEVDAAAWDRIDTAISSLGALFEVLEPAVSEEGMDQPELDRLRAAVARVKGGAA